MDPDLTHNISEQFNEGYCKYLCTYYGEPVAAGYLTYYKDKFTFYGLQQGGWIEFMMREADTDWDKEVWTVAYNTNVDFDGTVLERCIEYYSRLEIDAIAEGEDYDLPGGMYVTDLGKTSALVIWSAATARAMKRASSSPRFFVIWYSFPPRRRRGTAALRRARPPGPFSGQSAPSGPPHPDGQAGAPGAGRPGAGGPG